MLPSGDLLNFGYTGNNHRPNYLLASGLLWGRLRKSVFQSIFYGELGVVRVLTSQGGFTRPSSIYFRLGIVRDIAPLFIIHVECN